MHAWLNQHSAQKWQQIGQKLLWQKKPSFLIDFAKKKKSLPASNFPRKGTLVPFKKTFESAKQNMGSMHRLLQTIPSAAGLYRGAGGSINGPQIRYHH